METRASIFWDQLVCLCTLAHDGPVQRRRKVTLVLIAALTCLVAGTSLVHAHLTSTPANARLLPSIYLAVVGVALVAFVLTKRFGLLLYSFLVAVLVGPFLFQMATGGYARVGTVSIVYWSLLAPLGAMMFDRLSRAPLWLLAYLVLIVVSLLFDHQSTAFFVAVPHNVTLLNQGLNIGGFSITIFIGMAYYVRAFHGEHAMTKDLVAELSRANDELGDTLSQLRATQAELVRSEKMASVGKLAAGIAHELNNPVGALRSAVTTTVRCADGIGALVSAPEGGPLSRYLRAIGANQRVLTTASDRLAETVAHLVEFTRLDEAEFDRVDVHRGLESSLALVRSEIAPGVEVVQSFCEAPEIGCYPGRLNQVFMALLTHAAHATEAGDTITVRTRLEGDRICIEVADTGRGIPATEIDGLFDPGFTSSGERVRGGFGLGASYHIVQEHNGSIEVSSEVGKGSLFTVSLPLQADEEGPS